jgi:TRAP-type uncharacterized transport system substrate-binding protein
VPIAAAFALHAAALPAVAQVKMLTGTEATDLQIGRELAELVAAPAGLRLDVLPSASAPESLNRLRAEPGVKLAAVQSDVYQAFLAQAARTEASANGAAAPRVVLRLPEKEIQFVARADAPFDYVHQIKDAKINAGPAQSGTAVTTAAIYRLLFGKALAGSQASHLPHEAALVNLVTDRTIDVVAIAAGQPAPLLANMKPEARDYVKLLRLDARHPASQAALRAYSRATVRAASYPALLAEDVPALAVKMYLVTLDFRDHLTETRLIHFGRSLCSNFSALQAKGHSKWREVEPRLAPLPDGWSYYQPTQGELRNCRHRTARPSPLTRLLGAVVPKPARGAS